MLYSLSRVLLAARAHGLAALDGVHLDLTSGEDEFRRICQQGSFENGKYMTRVSNDVSFKNAFLAGVDWIRSILNMFPRLGQH